MTRGKFDLHRSLTPRHLIDKLKEALIKSTDYSVPSAVADGHHSSDDISSTCMLMTLTRGHPLPRTVLNTHLIRGS